MKVRVNHEVCEGIGRCQKTAPEVFEVRDDDLSHVKLDPVPERYADAVADAVRRCPRQAVSVEPE